MVQQCACDHPAAAAAAAAAFAACCLVAGIGGSSRAGSESTASNDRVDVTNPALLWWLCPQVLFDPEAINEMLAHEPGKVWEDGLSW